MNALEFESRQQSMSNKELIEQVKKQISELAKTGGQSHRMCVPPQVTDTDMILSEMVRRFELLPISEPTLPSDEEIKELITKLDHTSIVYQQQEIVRDWLQNGIKSQTQMEEVTDEDISKEAKLKFGNCNSDSVFGFREGAKAMRDGKIPHITK